MNTSFFPDGAPPKRAVAYYRHSAEDKQENSVPIQRELIRAFAAQHSIEIIHEEEDEGKTGLLADRSGFQRVLNAWVLCEHAPPFEYVLVRDVDRWARFQNPNEWGYYEFLCNRRGKKVVDISLGFPREDQPLATNIMTLLKREMAAEYSRQLSEKVFHGCVYVSRQGFSAGGQPCYGMGRLLLNEQREPKGMLQKGEHKQIANQRVQFVPLRDVSTSTVKDIFTSFDKGTARFAIADTLNKKGIPAPGGGRWDVRKVLRILQNETYTGKRIYNKTWNRLKQGRRLNPRNEWVVCADAFPAIISEELFRRVREQLAAERQRVTSPLRTLKQKFLRDLGQYLAVQRGTVNALQQFPVAASRAVVSTSTRQWCFYAPAVLRRHSHILCLGVLQGEGKPRFFLIPSSEFGVSGVCVLREGGRNDQKYALTGDQLGKTVLEIAQRTLSSCVS